MGSETRNRDYLSPEPMLQNPRWVASELGSGHQVPAYAYARNNPVAYSDPTGLYVGSGLAMCWSDCVRETLLDDPALSRAQSVLYPAAIAAGNEVCQTAAGTAASDAFGGYWTAAGREALEVTGSSFRITRAAGGAAAAASIVAQAACFVHCRMSFEPNPRYRAPGDSNAGNSTSFTSSFRGPRY